MSHITMFDTVALGHIINESLVEQASHRCPNLSCTGGLWDVQCLSAANELWRVSSETGGSFRMAGVTPCCPWCGADLEVVEQPLVQLFPNGQGLPLSTLATK